MDDLASAYVHFMTRGYDGPLVNIGSHTDVTICEQAETVMRVVGFEGQIVFGTSKPDGKWRRPLYACKLKKLIWKELVSLGSGISEAYKAVLL